MTDQALERIDRFAEARIAHDDVPGLALAITDREGLLAVRTYGYANLEAETPLTPEHRFEFGSIGKSFTSIVLLQLADEGKVDLQEPVTDFLPWFEVPSKHAPITLHHLMTHTAGITNGTDFPADRRYEVWALRETEASAPPGARFHYSNVGYKALGLVIERVTGASYGDNVRRRILEPLGMRDTVPAITHAERATLARGYAGRYDDRPWHRSHGRVPAIWLETDTADGCILSTPADLATYLRMLMNRGQPDVLTEQQFEQMTTRHATMDAEQGWDYGYGLILNRIDGQSHLGHGGGMVGYFALMIGGIEDGLGVVTMVNAPGDQMAIATYALKAVRAALAGQEIPDPPAIPDPREIEESPRYAGRYRGDAGELRLVADGPSLTLVAGGQRVQLEERGEGVFLAPVEGFDRYLLRVEEDDTGEIIGLSHGPDFYLLEGSRAPELDVIPDSWRAYTGHYRSHNPWFSNFRVYLRRDKLYFCTASGAEEQLTPRADGSFWVGEPGAPEVLHFDTIVDGEAWRALFSGAPYYRFFTD